jgi:hypothetical protein
MKGEVDGRETNLKEEKTKVKMQRRKQIKWKKSNKYKRKYITTEEDKIEIWKDEVK